MGILLSGADLGMAQNFLHLVLGGWNRVHFVLSCGTLSNYLRGITSVVFCKKRLIGRLGSDAPAVTTIMFVCAT